jgi:hypothetical protein
MRAQFIIKGRLNEVVSINPLSVAQRRAESGESSSGLRTPEMKLEAYNARRGTLRGLHRQAAPVYSR